MGEELIFNEEMYDLEGLLGRSNRAMADFIFVIQEGELPIYYLDRNEAQKYDRNFNQFVMRVRDYLEKEGARALFVLFATIESGQLKLYNDSDREVEVMSLGDFDQEEEVFYGMVIQSEEGQYIFREAIYRGESYQGDAHVELIQNGGELTEFIQQYILVFE